MHDCNATWFARQRKHFSSSDFCRAISEDCISDVLAYLKFHTRKCFYTPFLTLFGALTQVLSDDGSCRQALSEILLLRRRKTALHTGSFCKAKARLPLELLKILVERLALSCEENVVEKWLWRHGPVKVVDGTGFSMADTKDNLKTYPRHTCRNDVGFPTGRLVALFSLATGALIGMRSGPSKGKGTGETSLFYELISELTKGDTLLGDCLYSAYWIAGICQQRGVHVVAQLRKKSQWRLKKKADQIITIKKPQKPAPGIPAEIWNALSETITVRIIKLQCAPKGFRPTTKYILTTHLDKTVTADDIRDLYRRRWQVELNFRSLKTVLGLDVIRAKSASMVEKEVWTYMLAYNLIRLKAAYAATRLKVLPSEISFRAVEQILAMTRRLQACGQTVCDKVIAELLKSCLVADRPDRYEPRATKRRPKNHIRLTESRQAAKKRLHKKYKGKAAA